MAARHGYQPMHPPKKEVSFDRMQEILAKRSTTKVEVMPSDPEGQSSVAGREGEIRSELAGVASAENTPPQLEWLERTEKEPYCRRTKCGRYSIAQGFVFGKAQYQIWKLTAGSAWFIQVGKPHYLSFREAMADAQADSEKR